LKLPRNVGGGELAKLLARYGYRVVRQSGSHIRLTSTAMGKEHHITLPAHKPLMVGTLSGIIDDVAAYLKVDRKRLIEELFE